MKFNIFRSNVVFDNLYLMEFFPTTEDTNPFIKAYGSLEYSVAIIDCKIQFYVILFNSYTGYFLRFENNIVDVSQANGYSMIVLVLSDGCDKTKNGLIFTNNYLHNSTTSTITLFKMLGGGEYTIKNNYFDNIMCAGMHI